MARPLRDPLSSVRVLEVGAGETLVICRTCLELGRRFLSPGTGNVTQEFPLEPSAKGKR